MSLLYLLLIFGALIIIGIIAAAVILWMFGNQEPV